MRRIPQSVALFAKPDSPAATELLVNMERWFSARGVSVRILDSHAEAALVQRDVAGCDIALVAGGDGSMIAVGRRLQGTGVPVLGINMGTLGFLTEIPAREWQRHCELLLAQGFFVRERLALCMRLFRGGQEIPLPDNLLSGAVNDVIFGRTTLARVINLNVRVDGQEFMRLRGDGLLLSTPVGSTGYAASAGGVMMHPDMRAMEITPVCPVLHASCPIVVPDSTIISVEQARPWTEVGVTIDGQDFFLLEPGDILELGAAAQGTLFACVEEVPYWKQLASKGFVTPPPSPQCGEGL